MQPCRETWRHARANGEQRRSDPAGFETTLDQLHSVLIQHQLEQLEQLQRLEQLLQQQHITRPSGGEIPHNHTNTTTWFAAPPSTIVENYGSFHMPQALRGSGTSVSQGFLKTETPLPSSPSSTAETPIVTATPLASTSVLGIVAGTNKELISEPSTKKIPKGKKKLKDVHKPKRPLSAYNYFFRDERQRILGTHSSQNTTGSRTNSTYAKKSAPHGKISFASLGKVIGKGWQTLSYEKLLHYKELAAKDFVRYKTEMALYKLQQERGGVVH